MPLASPRTVTEFSSGIQEGQRSEERTRSVLGSSWSWKVKGDVLSTREKREDLDQAD